MTTPNNAAALERFEAIIAEMHGTAFAWNGSSGYDDVMYRYAVALEKELAKLRAGLNPATRGEGKRATCPECGAPAHVEQVGCVDPMLGDTRRHVYRYAHAALTQPDALTSQPSGEAVAWRFLDEDGKPTSKWADIDAKPMHYWQGKLRAGPYPGTSIQYAQLLPQDHNDNGKGRDNQRQPQGTTSGGSPDYSRPSHPSADAPGVAVDEARADILALEVARRFTLNTEPQRRASLQCAVVDAIKRSRLPTADESAGWEGEPSYQDLIDYVTAPTAKADTLSAGMAVDEVDRDAARFRWAVASKQFQYWLDADSEEEARKAIDAALAPKPEGGHG